MRVVTYSQIPLLVKVPTGVVVGVSVTIILLVVAVVVGAVVFLMIRRKQNTDDGNLGTSYASMEGEGQT